MCDTLTDHGHTHTWYKRSSATAHHPVRINICTCQVGLNGLVILGQTHEWTGYSGTEEIKDWVLSTIWTGYDSKESILYININVDWV